MLFSGIFSLYRIGIIPLSYRYNLLKKTWRHVNMTTWIFKMPWGTDNKNVI